MSSADQPRLCAMNGNCGTSKPSSVKNTSICPATAWILSWPPVTMNAATLFRIKTLSRIVTWFWMQFIRSIILKYSELADPQRIGDATMIASAQKTIPS